MKKIVGFILLAMLVAFACDPIEDRDALSGNVSANELELLVTPILVDGLKSNEYTVGNNSSVLSKWITARTTVLSSYGTVVLEKVGENSIDFKGLNGDGSYIEKNVNAVVDTMTNLTADTEARLGIVKDENGVVDETSMPYFWGSGDFPYEITVVQETGGGDEKGNKLTVACNAPYLCDWTFGPAKSNRNKGDLFVTGTGAYPLTLKMTKSDGSVVEEDLGEYEVEMLTYVPQELLYLFGDFITNPEIAKTWQWAPTGKIWANGPLRGFIDPGSGWWQNEYADMAVRQDGTMTFKFADMSLTKTTVSGDEGIGEEPGTYTGGVEVDLATKTAGYSIGTLKLDGVTVLYGIDVNDGNGPFTQMSIVKVTENTLILGGDSDATGQTWLYKFEKAE